MGSKVHIHSNPYANMAPGADRDFFQKNNPYGMTVSQMRHQYNKQLAEGGRSLKDLMAWSNSPFNTHVKPSTQYQYLINDTGEEIPGLRTYESLGMENRPLADQFGGVHDLDAIKATWTTRLLGTTMSSKIIDFLVRRKKPPTGGLNLITSFTRASSLGALLGL